jgi:transcriptional regulator with XRE-family HTH domain
MTGGIGAVIRQLRQSRGLTLRQLAAQLDIHFSHLSKIENGRDQPGRAVLNRVAQVLQVDFGYWVGLRLVFRWMRLKTLRHSI